MMGGGSNNGNGNGGDAASTSASASSASSTSSTPSTAASHDTLIDKHYGFIKGLKEGELVDWLDKNKKWQVGRVVNVNHNSVEIQSMASDRPRTTEWLPRSSDRIQPPHSHPATNKKMREPSTTQGQTSGKKEKVSSSSIGRDEAEASSNVFPNLGVPAASAQSAAVRSYATAASSANASNRHAATAPSSQSTASSSLSVSAPSPSPSPQPSSSPFLAVVPQPHAQSHPHAAPQHSAPVHTPVQSPPSQPQLTSDELKKFRQQIKVGDLVDYEPAHQRGVWHVGEVSRMNDRMLGLREPELVILNLNTQAQEVISRDSNRIMPPMTKSQQITQQNNGQQQQQHDLQQQQQQLLYPQAHMAQHPAGAPPAFQATVAQGRPGNIGGGAYPISSPTGAPGGAPLGAGPALSPHALHTPAAGGPASSPLPKTFGYELRVGDLADVLDTSSKWVLSEILQADQHRVYVHYIGWGKKWDEWIERNSDRLQPPRTRTEGYTGNPKKPPTEMMPSPPPQPPARPPQPPPRPSYSCLAACAWKRVLTTGMGHKEIQQLNEIFAACCYVQDSYQEVLLDSHTGHAQPSPSFWQQSPPPPVFKHTIATVSELLSKLEADIATARSSLPDNCQFPLQQCAAIAANIRGLIIDEEEATRRQMLAMQEEEYMRNINQRFRIVNIPSDGSCLFSAVGIGHQIQDAVLQLEQNGKSSPSASASHESKMDEMKADSDSSAYPTQRLSEETEAKRLELVASASSQIYQLFRQSADSKFTHDVAKRCRSNLISFLRAHSGITTDDMSWLERIRVEVKECLAQEFGGGGKYSDATSKAVLEEMRKRMGGEDMTQEQMAQSKLAIESYLSVMSQEGIYGTGLEVEALSELLQSPIHIFYRSEAAQQHAAASGIASSHDSIRPERTIGDHFSKPPICLAYYIGKKHYNLLVERQQIPPEAKTHQPQQTSHSSAHQSNIPTSLPAASSAIAAGAVEDGPGAPSVEPSAPPLEADGPGLGLSGDDADTPGASSVSTLSSPSTLHVYHAASPGEDTQAHLQSPQLTQPQSQSQSPSQSQSQAPMKDGRHSRSTSPGRTTLSRQNSNQAYPSITSATAKPTPQSSTFPTTSIVQPSSLNAASRSSSTGSSEATTRTNDANPKPHHSTPTSTHSASAPFSVMMPAHQPSAPPAAAAANSAIPRSRPSHSSPCVNLHLHLDLPGASRQKQTPMSVPLYRDQQLISLIGLKVFESNPHYANIDVHRVRFFLADPATNEWGEVPSHASAEDLGLEDGAQITMKVT